MKYGERLRSAREAKNLTQYELSEASGVKQGTISKIERGDQLSSRFDMALADALNVLPRWLQSGTGPRSIHDNLQAQPTQPESQRTQNNEQMAPIISQVQAGEWAEAIDIFEPGDGTEWLPTPPNTSRNAVWLRVVGDSMTNPMGAPTIPEGALVLVDPESPPDNGKIVVAKLTDSNEVTLKKLVIDAGRKWLKPLNPAYPMLEINGNCNIVGVVKKMEYNF